ncbi:MAG: VIT1/CCC1 transporter family protein, partial [Acidobacteriota bacterium]|nr:VIT1/CCC1 transporter family protein [Acidobacteriota bacterium]
MAKRHSEGHKIGVGGWLRAAVLGANDGAVSIASLVIGVAAAHASTGTIFTAGLAGLVGGALSMAVGEYVSVSSQRDVEEADLELERSELRDKPEHELAELTGLLTAKGLTEQTA